MVERGERMMALKWPAGLWRKTEEDGCVSREEDGGQGAAALIFSFFQKGGGDGLLVSLMNGGFWFWPKNQEGAAAFSLFRGQ
jgi:hypothetical protein